MNKAYFILLGFKNVLVVKELAETEANTNFTTHSHVVNQAKVVEGQPTSDP